MVLKFSLQAIHLTEVEVLRSRLEWAPQFTHGSDTALVVIRNAPITDADCSLNCTRDNKAANFIEFQVHQKDCIHQRYKRWDGDRGTHPP